MDKKEEYLVKKHVGDKNITDVVFVCADKETQEALKKGLNEL